MGSRSPSIGDLERVPGGRTPGPGYGPAGVAKASPSAPSVARSFEQTTPVALTEKHRQILGPGGAVPSGTRTDCGHGSPRTGDFASHILDAYEQEREAVARELHDDIGQRLSLVEMLLSEVNSNMDAATISRLQPIRLHIQNANETARHISNRIYPTILKDLGLPAALKSLVVDFEQKQKMAIRLVCRNVPDADFKRAGLAIYRIAQEALTNSAKHAGETVVDVALKRHGRMLELRVMDRGVGFDRMSKAESACMGLRTMEERARGAGGDLVVQASPGRGAAVIATIPLE